MSVTVFLDEALGDRNRLVCEEAKLVGEVVWATSADDGREIVVPLSNVCGIEGDEVDQRVDELESPGGRFTELVTDIS